MNEFHVNKKIDEDGGVGKNKLLLFTPTSTIFS